MPTPRHLRAQVAKVHRATAATLSLRGDDRPGFWDVRKGITAPAEFRLVGRARGSAAREIAIRAE
ncbi:hypothetical protein [Actinokineospora sp. UTMC 2448]|uniref:hypothetical protein n=1 Tax=Actinokineospora sp. UTMC 2448 TaxID=2268449 RepID=UPI00216426FF|nr:hypothetical protein [Actinokineospora sp. UTMC 2448]UVS80177.1 hypothetical protein Actkin_03927 [Actinokineospora sp. UTMC 2448]